MTYFATLLGGMWIGYAVGTDSHFPVLSLVLIAPGWWKSLANSVAAIRKRGKENGE